MKVGTMPVTVKQHTEGLTVIERLMWSLSVKGLVGVDGARSDMAPLTGQTGIVGIRAGRSDCRERKGFDGRTSVV